MKDIKVKQKLYGISGFLIFALIITSFMAVVFMADVNNGTTEVSNNWLPSVILAEELNTETSNFRIIEASHVISEDRETMLEHEKTIELISEQIQSSFYEYSNNLVTNEVDKKLIEDAEFLWNEYLIIHKEMIEYSKVNDTVSAMHIMENESELIFDEVSLIFLELVQFNKNGADEANIAGDEVYNRTKIIFLIVVIITISISFIVSRITILSIIKPVREIETASLEILKGNLSTEIKYESKDELGKLSDSMRALCLMIKEVIVDLDYVLGGMADGDYSIKTKNKSLYVGEFENILKSTDNISDKLSEAIFTLHHRDLLTDFYNRVGFSTRIDEIMNKNPKSMGVLSININGLKLINEKSGITAGDTHIKNSANYLKNHFNFEFFRMSGDEMIGIAFDIEEEMFQNQVNQLHKAMKTNENYDFSLGHAYGKGNFELWKLIQEADTIMYINKQEYYSASNRLSENIDNVALSELMECIENEEFMIYLQPQVTLKDGELYGAEALIRRFDKKNQKMVFPDQFISLYEQKSIIRHVDIFVVESVCKLLQKWQQENKQIPISVNLSRVTLLEYGIVDTIARICDKYSVPHKFLVIEVTERVGLIENNVASSLIMEFKDQGFHISLDDFGCAYSNIITLAQIEVDEVKIDKSLVDNITTNAKNHVLVKNVLLMCNELEGTTTLAEGIEDEKQAQTLAELGCVLGQGYYYSRPIPVGEFSEKYID